MRTAPLSAPAVHEAQGVSNRHVRKAGLSAAAANRSISRSAASARASSASPPSHPSGGSLGME